MALSAGRGAFSLVLIAWSALAASLGALLLLRLRGGPPGPWTGAAVALAGVVTVVLWERSPWAGDLFKLLPALTVALAVGAFARGVAHRRGLRSPGVREGSGDGAA